MKRNKGETPRRLMVVLLICLCLSCAVIDYGSILPDRGAEGDFEAMRMDSRLNYYYSGPDALPNAIVGLNKKYTIMPDLWKPVENEKSFADQIKAMRARAIALGTLPRGFLIRDHKGYPIGTWFSLLQGRTYVKMGKDREVIIETPELLLYEKNERVQGLPARIK
jgi:hypothetical protein